MLYAHELGLVPITTPAYSPESNGLAEGFVHTFKRDSYAPICLRHWGADQVRDRSDVLIREAEAALFERQRALRAVMSRRTAS